MKNKVKVRVTATTGELENSAIPPVDAAKMAGAICNGIQGSYDWTVWVPGDCTKSWAVRNQDVQLLPSLDLTKPVQTRDGRKVEIKFVDESLDTYPVVGVVVEPDGKRFCENWTIDGRVYGPDHNARPKDLVQALEPLIEGWVNIYTGQYGNTEYSMKCSKVEADNDANQARRIACVKIQYRKGEGL